MRTSLGNVPRPGPVPFVIDEWRSIGTGVFVELSFAQSGAGFSYLFDLSYFHPATGEPYWGRLSELSINRTTGEQFVSEGHCYSRADLTQLLAP